MTKTIFNLNDELSIGNYLVQNKIIQSIAQIRKIEKAGDGNMNFAVRIKTTGGSFILKQSRPYVEKYPQIPAPEHRVSMESRFYQLVSRSPGIVNHMPRIVHSDSEQDVLILQDLGELSSFEQIYSGYKMTRKEVDQLIDWLKELHSLPFEEEERTELVNREMRILNHEHIFDLPLKKNNGIDLNAITKGLQREADRLKNNKAYVERVTWFGELYLRDGKCLLHGDYYPASWLRKDGKIFVIDTEFAFFGSKEFDFGIMWAHFLLSDQEPSITTYLLRAYQELDLNVAGAYAGIEIMRRLMGVAQLPLKRDLEQKKKLLAHSEMLVLP